MTKIFLSFSSDSAEDLYTTLTILLNGQARMKRKYSGVEGEIDPPTDAGMAHDASPEGDLTDAEYDAKYDPDTPKPEFPPEEQTPKAAGGKPNGGGDPVTTPPPSAPKRPGRPPKAVSAPAPAPAPPSALPPFAAIRDAIVDAFKRQEPKGVREAAEAMRKKAGYDRIMAMPDTPELQTVLWEFCQAQGIEVV